jgi:hypothetical protein
MYAQSRAPGPWKQRGPLAISLVAALVVTCGMLVLSSGRSSRVAIERDVKSRPAQTAESRADLTCRGGIDYPADVELVPDAVVTEAGREAVEYHAEVNIHQGMSVGLAWEAEVIDDRGQKVASQLAKGAASGKAGGTAATGPILARNLPDGYYMLRARVAVSPDDAPATVLEAVQYVQVAGGKWREMDDIQWRANSSARLAFRATTPPRKGSR